MNDVKHVPALASDIDGVLVRGKYLIPDRIQYYLNYYQKGSTTINANKFQIVFCMFKKWRRSS